MTLVSKPSNTFKLFAAVISFTAFAGLSAANKPAAKAPLSVEIVPREATLTGDEPSQHFVVLAKYADHLERDVTPQAAFVLSDPDKGQIDHAGKFVPSGVADIRLTANFEGRTAVATIHSQGAAKKLPFSFSRDICEIFTKRGCNGSLCHGGVKGKNGFKLSLGGISPHDDYKWIVEGGTYKVLSNDPGPKNPRISLKEPEKSLLLLKPTFTIPHGGGVRFAVGSRDYQTILNWVRAGAPYGEEAKGSSTSVQSVEIFPKEILLDPQGRRQVLITAHLYNGMCQDLTGDVAYSSNDESVATINDDGVIEAKKSGETAILVRAAGFTVSATVGVVHPPVEHYPKVPINNYIDKYVFDKLQRFNIIPSPLSSDGEFLRRVCLDLAGTLPPPSRVREFLASEDPHKREHLIEALLKSPEYVDYWSFHFSDLMRVTITNVEKDDQTAATQQWITDSIAEDKPYDQMARERIAGQGYSAPSRNSWVAADMQPPEVVMPEMVRVFMGHRIECAQCHNHPFESWTQDQFWGLAAFFAGMTELVADHVLVDSLAGGHVDQPHEMVAINPHTKAHVTPTFLDGTPLPPSQWMDPRMKLAKWMTSSPEFSEAAVDRIWGYFFNRGIVDPVDDFRSTNPPTNPELLHALAKDFRDHGYDLKYLIRTIVESRTYQLTSTPNATNWEDQLDYSRSLPRALEAAVLLDAISSATGVREKFEFHPDAGGGDPPVTAHAVDMLPDLCPSQFMDAFGRSMHKSLPGGPPKPNLREALDMLAGPTYTTKIVAPGGRLETMLKSGATNRQILDEFYWAALTRHPTTEEMNGLLAAVEAQPKRESALAGAVWAMISSREFAYNH